MDGARNSKVSKRKLKSDESIALPAKKLKTKATSNIESSISYEPVWSEYELLAEQQSLNIEVARNVIELFKEGNTIPFIARYRRDLTNNMSPETLRQVKEIYEEITHLKTKINTVLKKIEKSSQLTDNLKHSLTSCRSVEELDFLFAPHKPGQKRTLAERAKELGLEEPAMVLLENHCELNLMNYVGSQKSLSNITDVENGIIHIIAAVISTNTDILSELRAIRKRSNFIIKTKKMSSKSKNEPVSDFKFENYMNCEIPVKHIKPHQILGINRGESLKVLSVKVVVPESIFNKFKTLCYQKWLYSNNKKSLLRERIIKAAVDDSYRRLVEPLIVREVRAELKQIANKASCEVFSANLKQLLLMTPLQGKCILGIDPGFSKGCKIALISPTGNLIDHAVIFPHRKDKNKCELTLKNVLLQNKCELIALGNGTACRETESWLSGLISRKVFQPLDVQYTIVREEGASIYSCSPEAKKEFPNLDPNIISAVSLARRLQDPLAELIKVEPKHLGVGMYQHDVKKKQLEQSLDEIVSECVSFVGVDLNTTSECLLRHVAGISEKRAKTIIEYRNKNGPLKSRSQILDIPGIGQSVFRQCAGFLRIAPLNMEDASSFYHNSKATKLDCTLIHPESYDIAEKIIKKLGFRTVNVGEKKFVETFKARSQHHTEEMIKEMRSSEQTINLILDALSKPLNYDLRNEVTIEPLFKKELTSIHNIEEGTILTGIVTNVTHFGCFVDIGVGINGLIHTSKYSGLNLELGKRVEVKVINLDISKNRIGLQALKLL